MITRCSKRLFGYATQAAVIKGVKAREIYDSRGNPTVEVDIQLESDKFTASVPSGASSCKYEAIELRDKDPNRLHGEGVLKAVENINKIIGPALVNKDCRHQKDIDNFIVQVLDGTKNEWGYCKSKLGSNAILAISLALSRAGAKMSGLPLYKYIANMAGKDKSKKYIIPVPAFNVISGGMHIGNQLNFQEFMITPTGASSFKNAMIMGSEVYHVLRNMLKEKHGPNAIRVGDEGGFGDPYLKDEGEAFEFVMKAIDRAGHTGKVKIAIDIAASDFYIKKEKLYNIRKKASEPYRKIKGIEFQEMIEKYCTQFPIISVENPFDQDDFQSYESLTKSIGKRVQIVGDDLLATNLMRIKIAIEQKLCNALLLKINQIGTVTESIEACNLAKSQGWNIMVSNRSGETEDHFIADLAVGLGMGQIKAGAPCRSDRLAKYNQLLRIEEDLNGDSEYGGTAVKFPRI